MTSATFLATQVDFTNAGDLRYSSTSSSSTAIERMMNETGYLDGAKMATVFNMLRSQRTDLALLSSTTT